MVVSWNSISGEIPSEIGLMTFAELLKMQKTAMEGQMPTELGELARLTNMFMSETELSGTLPTEISGMQHFLTTLQLFDQDLTG